MTLSALFYTILILEMLTTSYNEHDSENEEGLGIITLKGLKQVLHIVHIVKKANLYF